MPRSQPPAATSAHEAATVIGLLLVGGRHVIRERVAFNGVESVGQIRSEVVQAQFFADSHQPVKGSVRLVLADVSAEAAGDDLPVGVCAHASPACALSAAASECATSSALKKGHSGSHPP